MTRPSKRELKRGIDKLTEASGEVAPDMDLTDQQARAIREYDLNCESPGELPDELEQALYSVVEGLPTDSEPGGDES